MAIGLQKAIYGTQEHFRKQCGGIAQAHWEVLSATEDVEKGVYVIQCQEKCCFDHGGLRAHEVWITIDSGELCHQHRIENPKR
jgi:hypothetical protein